MEPAYLRPLSVNDALKELDAWKDRARLLAGGTDLLVRIRQGDEQPVAIIDISGIDELRKISRCNGYVELGALITFREIEQHQEGLKEWAPVLVSACRNVGSVQIRNIGTLGGNLGTASPAGDLIPALYVLEAEVHLLSSRCERWVAVSDFFDGPGSTVCMSDEMITGVRFRPMEEGEKSFFQKIGQRKAVTISKASAAGTILLKNSVVSCCCLAIGAVAPTVIRVPNAEKYLTGNRLNTETINHAGVLAAESCKPIDDIRSTISYRRHMIKVLVIRGLQACR